MLDNPEGCGRATSIYLAKIKVWDFHKILHRQVAYDQSNFPEFFQRCLATLRGVKGPHPFSAKIKVGYLNNIVSPWVTLRGVSGPHPFIWHKLKFGIFRKFFRQRETYDQKKI